MKNFFFTALLLAAVSCTVHREQEPKLQPTISKEQLQLDEKFISYWYMQGKAEITSYSLEQARYGEIRKGYAVLIYVTEGFSLSKAVKLDDPFNHKEDLVSILKLNTTKSFVTGIYPYSMMSSVFTPIDAKTYPRSIKATATSQEWCGQTFTQINLDTNKTYRVQLFSYFEQEGDKQISLPAVLLEDEVWTKIRINPAELPVGEINLIPGLLAQRLRHTKLQSEKATTRMMTDTLHSISTYVIQYLNDERSLTITFNSHFPYEILQWEETYLDGFGAKKQKMTTRAIKQKTINIDYWKRNSTSDNDLRDSLGLPR